MPVSVHESNAAAGGAATSAAHAPIVPAAFEYILFNVPGSDSIDATLRSALPTATRTATVIVLPKSVDDRVTPWLGAKPGNLARAHSGTQQDLEPRVHEPRRILILGRRKEVAMRTRRSWA
ncbi:hypothetical protein GGF32_004603 [Allomyces javanicus]|nr:hypothetical protein GGF32_004603 [Allomyces javanicus]